MFLEASKSADGGKGVACLYGDYAGDVMDVTLAIEPAAEAELRRVSLLQVGDKTLMDAFLPRVEVTADSMGRLLSDGGQG